ncbi:glycosyltransferase family 2 protein [Cytophagaceae bacterium DM2B3-1]|uniref:Glycosyltransferase family 2 protein n=1 Tax=Xanthocytophaga flava TaxID=3048013 RepID=A0ABT7CJJ8_9BACT|nr:glycosyltransferase family 2 protein [Xanthocytophaga flavus]MDJ1467828.1 glycosyltransferase family 2 protein [Xanthocytophaga flavus]MDJ1493906.1 glycosyltransferase family 2 protein [Xanthocytophaga flavus]
MQVIEILFWICVSIVFYTFIGYALLVGIWAKVTKLWTQKNFDQSYEPEVTLVIPAYNEADILAQKVENCLELDYPAEKLQLIVITDGSNDHSASILEKYPRVLHVHEAARKGKAAAENRVMHFVKHPLVIFTDSNTRLNKEAVREIIKHYHDPKVGAVSGEKKVQQDQSAAGNGEGLYWKYESFLKRCDSDIYSLMGAAGELVSFRKELFAPLEEDSILDDFVQSLRIVEKGYKVVYEPKAFASELPSESLKDEMKRKIRICAGGWQSMSRLTSLLNIFKHPVITFLYVSHRVLRWSLTPLMLAILLPVSAYLSFQLGGIYTLFTISQILFYAMAYIGWYADGRGRKIKLLLIPLYFSMMNVAVFFGFLRFVRQSQPAAWEKAKRSAYA